MPGISFIASTTATVNVSTSLVVNRPSGVADGDFLLAFVTWDIATRSLTLPSGWTLAHDEDPGSSGPLRMACAWKAAGASEPSTYTFTFSGSTDGSVLLLAYAGVAGTPVDVVDGAFASATSSIVAPSVTTTVDDTLVVVAGGVEDDTTVSTPAGTTSRAAVESTANINASARAADYAQASAGATGTKTFTAGTATEVAAITVALVAANTAPNAPTNLTPDGSTLDLAAVQTFDWDFSDPDVGDSQSQYELRYQIVGAGSWTTVGPTASTTTSHDFAGATFSAGNYEWQARTWDALGLAGPWSASSFFTAAAAPATPTITAPTNGSTISAEDADFTWSTPSQTSYQVRKVADSGGSPDTGTVYYDSGEVVSASTRTVSLNFPTNNRTEHLQVRVKASGLWSSWASVSVDVDYTPPATPTATVVADTPTGAITITATHPAPSGGEPTVTSHDIYRRVTADGGDGIRVAAEVTPAGSFIDYAVASGVDYEFRVKANGDNGVTAFSAWDG